MKPQEIVKFMTEIEGLKRELRHSWLSDGRHESVAEHVWSAMMLSLLLVENIEIKVDQLKLLKMILIHDLVEIYAGDMPAFEEVDKKELKEKHEKESLDKILSLLTNENLKNEFKELWYEFEAGATNEAKLALVCDKAEAIIQHNNADISTFSQGDYDINPFYRDDLFNFDKFVREFKDYIDYQTMKKFEEEGDMDRISEEHRKKWEELKHK